MAVIRRIQALNYRCLRSVDARLDRFHVLVGPNGSGKSTLFDAVGFLADMVARGLEAAVRQRSRNFQDLVWGRPGKELGFELALELELPEEVASRLPRERGFKLFRYEIRIEEERSAGVRIASERGLLIPGTEDPPQRKLRFPDPPEPPATILLGGGRPGCRTVLSKSGEARDSFNIEVTAKPGKGWVTNISLGSARSALRNLPESPEQFPASTHVKRVLRTETLRLFLDSGRMRRSSPPPGRRREVLEADGSNLPRVIRRMQEEHAESFRRWLDQVRTSLPSVRDIRVVDREDDRHCYLMIRYRTGIEVPSWMVSDGTLRLLALTLPAYLPDSGRIYLVEEPEDGLHPGVVQDVYDALSSVHDSQVLLATHSPLLLSHADLEHVLCFGLGPGGAAHVIPAAWHPRLGHWQGEPNPGVHFAAGVLE